MRLFIDGPPLEPGPHATITSTKARRIMAARYHVYKSGHVRGRHTPAARRRVAAAHLVSDVERNGYVVSSAVWLLVFDWPSRRSVRQRDGHRRKIVRGRPRCRRVDQ